MDDKFKCPKCGKDDRLVRHIFNTTEWHTCAECGFDAYSLSEHYKAQQAEIADLKERIRQLVEFRKMADPVLTKATGEKYEFSDGK